MREDKWSTTVSMLTVCGIQLGQCGDFVASYNSYKYLKLTFFYEM